MNEKWLYTISYAAMLLYALVPVTSTAFADNALRLACLMLLIMIAMRHKLQNNGIIKIMAVYSVALIISVLVNPNIKEGLNLTWQRIFEMSPFVIMVTMIQNKGRIYSLLKVFLAAMLIADVTYIYQFSTKFILANNFGYRPSGFFYWEGWFMQIFLLMVIPICVIMWSELWNNKRKTERALIGVTLFLSLIACLMSFSRGVWLTLVLFLFFYSAIRFHKRTKAFFSIVLGMAVFMAVFMASFPVVKDRLVSIFDVNIGPNANRVLAWQSSWHMFKDYPLFGLGQGNWFTNYKEKYINPAETERVPNAHSNYMQLLAETGAIGFSTYMALMLSVLVVASVRWRSAKNNEQRAGAAIMFFSMANFLFIGIMGDFKDTRTVVETLWFTVGAGYVLGNEKEDQKYCE
ncbi:O-antigen ligase family protein [Azotosporobacter soli]|uniref:O-antigen ligase family protein n=1 Tax=Azotosporobacter soli TaxID=3055040 RepID=UPI0031FF2BBC